MKTSQSIINRTAWLALAMSLTNCSKLEVPKPFAASGEDASREAVLRASSLLSQAVYPVVERAGTGVEALARVISENDNGSGRIVAELRTRTRDMAQIALGNFL